MTDYAVVVGIAKYPGLTDLAGPDTDAQAVHDWLVDPAGGRLDEQNVELIRSAQFDPVDPQDPKPASGAVKAALVRIAAKTQQAPGNRLYLYFSGHGFAPTLEEGALFTAEASQLAPFHVYAHSWLKAFRRAGLFRDVVLWMDCCMNYQQSIMVDEADMRIAQSTRPPGPAFVGLAAQTKSALEHTMPDGKVHGVFTWTLLEGLKGGAADERGRVTGESLKAFLQSAMPEFLPDEARRAAAVDLHPFVRADEGMVFTRFAERPTYPVRLRIPKATAGQRLHLWTGRPHVAAVSEDLAGPEWTGRLVRGLYVAEVPGAGLRQGFQVTGSGPLDVAVDETGPPVKRADWSRLYPLNVVADNAAAEIMVADYKFDRIFTETGALHDRDAAGVYKIRVQIGRDIATASEKVVLLDRELVDGGQVAAPPLPSPAPIPGSALTSESHVRPFSEAAARAGDFQPARPGAATISIMARYWTDPATTAPVGPLPHPMEGLQLSGASGSFPDFRPEDRKVDDQAGGDPVAVWEREVAPGVYYLRQTQHDGRQLEAAVVAVAGWVTQVVIQRTLPGPAAAEGQGRAAATPLDEAAVFMRATHKPRRPERDAVIEAARIALAQGRNLFAEGRGADLQDQLLRKCDDPIGGIIGCHLLLVAMDANGVVDPARTRLFDTAVRNLRRLVGPDHPDVAALSLRATDPQLRFPGPFTAPPMFARSWQLITDASYDRPDLIPAALWDRVHASIILGPFLVWAADEQSRALHAEQLAQWVRRYTGQGAAAGAGAGAAAGLGPVDSREHAGSGSATLPLRGAAPGARSVQAAPARAALGAPPLVDPASFGVYVHVPFCLTRCHYCDFVTYTGMEGLRRPYAAALLEEAAMAVAALGPEPPVVTSVFVGGGTPTLLPAEDLARVLARLRELLPVAPGAEVTVEANPETVDAAMAAGLVGAGATRVSMGAQSFDDRVLAALGRVHDAARVEAAVATLRAAGVPAVNLDLIYGGPGEDDRSWSATLDAAVALGPEHLSAYALTIEPATKFGRLVAAGRMPEPAEDDLADRYATACTSLADAGYHHYEVSNWARPSHPSRHNLTYWRRGRYLGLGAGAHEFDGATRRWNLAGVPAYLQAVNDRRRPTEGEERLDGEQARFEALALRLRTVDGLAPEEARALGVDPGGEEADRLRDAGLLAPGPGLALTEKGMFLHGEAVARLA